MGKHWAREQVRQDEMQDAVDKSLVWVQENRQTALTIIGGVVLALAVVGGVAYQMKASRAAAWERLGLAQSYAYSGRLDTAFESLKQLSNDYPSSDANGFGIVFAGDLNFQTGKYKEAAEAYTRIIEKGAPKALVPVALSGLVKSQEAAGLTKEAAQTAQRFLDAYGDHYLAPQVHASLARSLQAAGQTAEAKAAFQKIALQYPETSFAAWAQAQLK